MKTNLENLKEDEGNFLFIRSINKRAVLWVIRFSCCFFISLQETATSGTSSQKNQNQARIQRKHTVQPLRHHSKKSYKQATNKTDHQLKCKVILILFDFTFLRRFHFEKKQCTSFSCPQAWRPRNRRGFEPPQHALLLCRYLRAAEAKTIQY